MESKFTHPVITAKEAAKIAEDLNPGGRNPSAQTISRVCQRGGLEFYKSGGVRLIYTKDFLNWLKGYPHKTGAKTKENHGHKT